jgi:porin
VSLSAQLGWSDPDGREAGWHAGAGVVWNGPIGGREDDATGFGATWVGFSRRAGSPFEERGELALELFYRLQLTPFFSVKPDIQYVLDPSGDPDIDNALVTTLRIEVQF